MRHHSAVGRVTLKDFFESNIQKRVNPSESDRAKTSFDNVKYSRNRPQPLLSRNAEFWIGKQGHKIVYALSLLELTANFLVCLNIMKPNNMMVITMLIVLLIPTCRLS